MSEHIAQLIAQTKAKNPGQPEFLQAVSEVLETLEPVMERVSQRRLNFLKLAYRQVGMSPTDALHRAQLTYAAYVGFLQLVLQLGVPRIDHSELEEYVEHVMSTLIPQ